MRECLQRMSRLRECLEVTEVFSRHPLAQERRVSEYRPYSSIFSYQEVKTVGPEERWQGLALYEDMH